VAPARRFEIAVTTFQRRYFGSGQHLDIRLRLDLERPIPISSCSAQSSALR
jgi:hypothetical protein